MKKWKSLLFTILVVALLWVSSMNVFAAGNRDWKWPVPASNSLSSCYLDGRSHYALDIVAGQGTAVYASYPGTVIATSTACTHNYGKSSSCGCNGGLGNYVYVRHTYNGVSYVSCYIHLTGVNVSVGSSVTKDTVIGTVGSTGYSTGFHLDFRIYQGSSTSHSTSACVDPFKDQFLEMPSGLNANGATTSCCYTYVDEVKALYATSLDNAPVGTHDSTTGGVNSISVRGWAFDPDSPSDSLEIHIYVDRVHVATCVANQIRTDVNNVYGCGAYHGFEHTFPYEVSETGTHEVRVYAINRTDANLNKRLDNSPQTVTVTASPPVISNIKIKNMNEDGYDVECKVTSSSGVDRVQFPTWTPKDGQDDIDNNWQTSAESAGTSNGDIYTFHVNKADHNNETGTYFTHIYAYGKNETGYTAVRVEDYLPNDSEYGYTPLDSAEYNGHTYLLFEGQLDESGNPNATWTEAATYCQSIGGYLASITSQEENDIIASMVSEYGSTCWIGANDLETEGTFVWESGEEISYMNWQEGQQDNSNGDQDYVGLRVDGMWDDGSYELVHAFICEIPHTHSYTSSVTKQATCTEDGTKTFACDCGDSYTESIAVLGHAYDDWTTVKEPTSSTEGLKERTCEVCGDTQQEAIGMLPAQTNPFTDVKESDYYYEPVLWAVNSGITSGLTATTFAPEAGCTRGQVVTFLWRAAGKPSPASAECSFTDVPVNEYYRTAVLWAVENGITSGLTETTFAPESECTRGQIVTFLWRAAGQPVPSATTCEFKDVASNVYYRNAVLWAVEKGITSGLTSDKFGSENVCTRGQVVTFLYRSSK